MEPKRRLLPRGPRAIVYDYLDAASLLKVLALNKSERRFIHDMCYEGGLIEPKVTVLSHDKMACVSKCKAILPLLKFELALTQVGRNGTEWLKSIQELFATCGCKVVSLELIANFLVMYHFYLHNYLMTHGSQFFERLKTIKIII